jgi:hypothetical protein
MGFFDKVKKFLGYKPADKEDNTLYKKEIDKGVKEKPVDKSGNLVRRFGGKLSGFKDNRERQFEKKHIKAYLNGDRYFRFGFTDVTDKEGNVTGREIAWHKTKEKWIKASKAA